MDREEFNLGQVVATPGALSALEEACESSQTAIGAMSELTTVRRTILPLASTCAFFRSTTFETERKFGSSPKLTGP